jgi:L-malate glycosyltransferase
MRILFVTSCLGLGGQEKQLVELVKGFDPRRVQSRVLVFAPGGERLPILKAAGIRVSEVRTDGHRFPARWKALRREDDAFKPHIILCFDITAALYATLTLGGKKGGLLLVNFSGNYFPGFKVRAAFQGLQRFLHQIICNSESGADYMRRHFRIAEERLSVIQNGLDLEAMDRPAIPVGSLRRELALPEGRPLVGIIGKLNWDKDPMVLVEAATIVHRTHPDAAFCFIGSGPYHAQVSAALETRNLGPHFFLVPQRPDAPWLAREFDIGALCSQSEGLPNVILEYMYWGKPCAVTAAGDSGRVVVDGETGFVVPIGHPDALAAAIQRLLSDPELARSMGQKGRRRLEEDFPIRRYVSEFQDLFDALRPVVRRPLESP